MRGVSRLEAMLTTWENLNTHVADVQALLELAQEANTEDRAGLAEEIGNEIGSLEREYRDLEVVLTLSQPYDARNALISIHAREGGTEAQDWTEMLLRMYLRWAESHKFKADILSLSAGEETGVKSVEVRIEGENAYGLLRSERGSHRLVRISPFDSSHSRHTTFALVEVMPEAEQGDVTVDIDPDDLRIDTYRASGHGGQNVQKNDTAVRILHIPTGIMVTCQNERSQNRNRESAMTVLHSRLLEMEIEKREVERAKIRGEHVDAGWGSQIRSYVLHPYKMVKDLRTNVETSDTGAVLDGGIDEFIMAYLRAQVGVDDGEAA